MKPKPKDSLTSQMQPGGDANDAPVAHLDDDIRVNQDALAGRFRAVGGFHLDRRDACAALGE